MFIVSRASSWRGNHWRPAEDGGRREKLESRNPKQFRMKKNRIKAEGEISMNGAALAACLFCSGRFGVSQN
jgi:hypothetical protein